MRSMFSGDLPRKLSSFAIMGRVLEFETGSRATLVRRRRGVAITVLFSNLFSVS